MTATHPEAPVLRIQNISKSFPGVNALTNMTLDLRHAEVHAVCGENGAGKSTLMKIITGIYKPDRGTMHLNGESLDVRNPNEAYAKGIAIIFQKTSLFPDLTVLENIFMGHELRKPLLGRAKIFSILDYAAMRKRPPRFSSASAWPWTSTREFRTWAWRPSRWWRSRRPSASIRGS